MWLTEISTTSLRVASAWGEYTGQELLTVSHSNLIERNNAQISEDDVLLCFLVFFFCLVTFSCYQKCDWCISFAILWADDIFFYSKIHLRQVQFWAKIMEGPAPRK